MVPRCTNRKLVLGLGEGRRGGDWLSSPTVVCARFMSGWSVCGWRLRWWHQTHTHTSAGCHIKHMTVTTTTNTKQAYTARKGSHSLLFSSWNMSCSRVRAINMRGCVLSGRFFCTLLYPFPPFYRLFILLFCTWLLLLCLWPAICRATSLFVFSCFLFHLIILMLYLFFSPSPFCFFLSLSVSCLLTKIFFPEIMTWWLRS